MIAIFFWCYMINFVIFFYSAMGVAWSDKPSGHAKMLLALTSIGFILGTKGIQALAPMI